MRVLVIHGPSLQALGHREPAVYGTETLADVDAFIHREAAMLGVDVECRQTDIEGQIVSWLHEATGDFDGVVMNPAAYTHTSRAIGDAIRSVLIPVVEVHLSNIFEREEWRRVSVTAETAVGVVAGFGARSYILGIIALRGHLGAKRDSVQEEK